jgi:nibrin
MRRRGHRQITQSRFKGFDDFDTSQIPIAQPIPEEDEEEPMEDVAGSALSQQAGISRKRPPPPGEDEDDMLDNLLPAAAARKRRRLGRDGSAQPEDGPIQVPEPRTVRKAKKEPKVDVLEAARAKREAEDEAARKDAESLKEAMEGIDIHGPAKLVDFEEMEIRPRERSNTRNIGASDRWDENWNGRKNFKRFRRKGEVQPLRGHRLLVPLEEAKKKDFGIGEEYWLESGSHNQKKKSQRESQAVPSSISQSLRGDDEDDSQFRRRLKDKGKRREQQENSDDDIQVVEDSLPAVAGEVVPRGSRRTQEARVAETQTRRGTKRPAVEPAKEVQPPTKRQGRATRRERDEDSEGSEDELKFRSRRKR